MRRAYQWQALCLTLLAGAQAAIRLTPVHPGPGDFIAADEFIVVVAIHGEAPRDALVELRIDGQAISSGITRAEGVITWVPDASAVAEARRGGPRSITVALSGADQAAAARVEWSFTLLAAREEYDVQRGDDPALRHNGRVYMSAGQYALGGDNRWELATGGTYRATSGRLRYGADIYLGNHNQPSSQDRNQYRATIGYGRWLSLQVGDTRPHFHDAILSGKRVRGLEFVARGILPGDRTIASLAIAWGQALRSAEPDTYARRIFASRLSFGSSRRFELGLTFLKGSDDPSSTQPPLDTLITMPTDTTQDTSLVQGATPEENAVLGADMSARLWQGRIRLYSSYAFAVRTRDITDSAITKATLDSAFGVSTIDPAALNWLITLNQSSLPLSGGRGVLNSSHIAAGLNLRLPLGAFTSEFDAAWKLQGANYHSMGSTLLGTGEQGLTLQNRLFALQNRLLFECGYARSSNNLDGLQSDATVTTRLHARISLFYSPAVPSVSVGYTYTSAANGDSSYGFSSRVNGINAVSGYAYALGRFSGTLQAYANWSGIGNDWNRVSFGDTTRSSDTSSFLSSGIYGLHLLTRIEDVPLEFTGGLSTNAGSSELLKMIHGNIGCRYRIVPGLLVATLGLRLGAARMPGATSYTAHVRIPYGAELGWRRHALHYTGYVTVETSTADAVNVLRYEWRF